VLACLACTTACGFHSATPTDAVDGSIEVDSRIEIDASIPLDAAVDGPPVRIRDGLIGLWAFDEVAGATVNDTSDRPTKVPLTVSVGSVTFANGTMTPDGVAVIASGQVPRLNADVRATGAVTLEAWVMPALASQGTEAKPVLVAGLCSSVVSRNISILQAGTRWVARIRTTPDRDGKPDLVSTTDIVPGVMTHLVVVADATQRVLYVDGKLDQTDPTPAAPLGWELAYKMALGNELAQGRQWMGTFALVAMYQQALSQALVDTNFELGANGP
jgi:hypothetical protein